MNLLSLGLNDKMNKYISMELEIDELYIGALHSLNRYRITKNVFVNEFRACIAR